MGKVQGLIRRISGYLDTALRLFSETRVGRLNARVCVQDKLILLCTFLSLSIILSACGSSKITKLGDFFTKTCTLPDNQANSLQGKWTERPIKLSYHTGDFSASEKSAIETAASTWNAFFTFSKGYSIIQTGTETDLTQTNPSCSGTTISDGVVVYKRQSAWTRSASAVAVTTFCTTVQSGTNIPRMYNAIIELNYVNYFGGTTGKVPDLQSISLHELGHLVGLDHSCGALRSGLSNVACPDAGSGDALVSTVMYPTVFFDGSGAGEEKRILQENDQNRANCLYSDGSTTSGS